MTVPLRSAEGQRGSLHNPSGSTKDTPQAAVDQGSRSVADVVLEQSCGSSRTSLRNGWSVGSRAAGGRGSWSLHRRILGDGGPRPDQVTPIVRIGRSLRTCTSSMESRRRLRRHCERRLGRRIAVPPMPGAQRRTPGRLPRQGFLLLYDVRSQSLARGCPAGCAGALRPPLRAWSAGRAWRACYALRRLAVQSTFTPATGAPSALTTWIVNPMLVSLVTYAITGEPSPVSDTE